MQNVKRNKFALIVVIAILALVSLTFIQKIHAQSSSINVQVTATATTTRTYLANGSGTATYQIDSYPTYSNTKVFSMAGIDSVYLYAQVEASTTATIFSFTPQFSNNGIDWYGVASSSTNGANAFTAVSTVYTWAPGTVATSTLVFKLPDIQGMHERVLTTATGAAGAVYEEIVLKKNASGQ